MYSMWEEIHFGKRTATSYSQSLGRKTIRVWFMRRKISNCGATEKKHLLIHSALKPYGCERCSKRYASKSSLGLHVRMHSIDEPLAILPIRSSTTQSKLKTNTRSPSVVKQNDCNPDLKRNAQQVTMSEGLA